MNEQLQGYVDLIARALADDAPPEVRAAGAEAAQAIATVLRAQPGQPLGAAAPSQAPSHLSMALDVLIARLKSELPEHLRTDSVDADRPIDIPFVRVPHG